MNSRHLTADYSTLVRFVSAQGQEERPSDSNSDTKFIKRKECKLSGEEAKSFYEETLKIKDENPGYKYDVNKKLIIQEKTKMFSHSSLCSTKVNSLHDFLRHAQNGDVSKLRKCLSKGVDITLCDEFGWNALMCAAHNGHLETAKLLLENGINQFQSDLKGRTASVLARIKGHQNVADLIEKFRSNDQQHITCITCSPEKNTEMENTKEKDFFCDVCKINFSCTSKIKHDSSTVHLFNLKLAPKDDPFVIPPSNVGYKLMVKSGWDGHKGLGVESQGKKYPIKTILKRDRACLGSKEQSERKAKVTHFGANDKTAVKSTTKNIDRRMSAKALSRKAENLKKKKVKNWERNLRHHMNYD